MPLRWTNNMQKKKILIKWSKSFEKKNEWHKAKSEIKKHIFKWCCGWENSITHLARAYIITDSDTRQNGKRIAFSKIPFHQQNFQRLTKQKKKWQQQQKVVIKKRFLLHFYFHGNSVKRFGNGSFDFALLHRNDNNTDKNTIQVNTHHSPLYRVAYICTISRWFYLLNCIISSYEMWIVGKCSIQSFSTIFFSLSSHSMCASFGCLCLWHFFVLHQMGSGFKSAGVYKKKVLEYTLKQRNAPNVLKN